MPRSVPSVVAAFSAFGGELANVVRRLRAVGFGSVDELPSGQADLGRRAREERGRQPIGSPAAPWRLDQIARDAQVVLDLVPALSCRPPRPSLRDVRDQVHDRMRARGDLGHAAGPLRSATVPRPAPAGRHRAGAPGHQPQTDRALGQRRGHRRADQAGAPSTVTSMWSPSGGSDDAGVRADLRGVCDTAPSSCCAVGSEPRGGSSARLPPPGSSQGRAPASFSRQG